MNEKLQMIGANILPAIAYGDAAGLPVEKQSAAFIRGRYGQIAKLEPVTDNPFIGEYPAGTTSDDTQLTLVSARSLIATNQLDMSDVARQHITAFHDQPIGWGGSTTQSVQRLEAGQHWSASGSPEGMGNGVLMKMAPFIIWKAAHPELPNRDFQDFMENFTRMTHDNDLSVVNTLTHNQVGSALVKETVVAEEVPSYGAFMARMYEKKYPGAGHETSKLLGHLATLTEITPDAINELAPRGGFYAPETLLMAYGALALESTFPASTYGAVNLGGDADSIGSIVSALSVMKDPYVVWPADMTNLQNLSQLLQLSEDFARAMKGARV